MKTRIIGLVVALLACSGSVEAQTVVPRGQTFTVEFNSPYPNDATVMRHQAFVDNVVTKTWTSAELTVSTAPLADCYGTATPPAGATCFLYRGTHPALQNTGTRQLKLWTTEMASGLNSSFSATVAFIVGNVPIAPTNPRISVVVTQAGVVFEFKSAPVTVDQVTASQPPLATVRIPVQR